MMVDKLAINKVVKDNVRTTSSLYPWYKAQPYTAKTMSITDKPCKQAVRICWLLKKAPLAGRGGRFINDASASSDSNTTEQAGSMISSRKATCMGNNSRGA